MNTNKNQNKLFDTTRETLPYMSFLGTYAGQQKQINKGINVTAKLLETDLTAK